MDFKLKTCSDLTCKHTLCARLRHIQKCEQDTGFQISVIHKFDAICDELGQVNRLLELRIRDLGKENDSLKQASEVHENEKKGLASTIEDLHQTIADLRTKLAAAEDDAKREQAKKEHEQALAKAHKEREGAHKICETLKKTIMELQKDNSELRNSNLEAEKLSRESGLKIEELTERIGKMDQAKAEAEKRLLDDGRKIKDLEDRLLAADDQKTMDKAKIQDLEVKHVETGKQAVADEAKIKELENQLLDARQQITTGREMAKKLETQVLEDEQSLTTLRELLQEEKNSNELFKQESEDRKQLTTNILSNLQSYVVEAINTHITDPDQIRALFCGQGQPARAAGDRIQSPDTGYDSSANNNTAASTPTSCMESKPTPQESHTHPDPGSPPEEGEIERKRIAFPLKRATPVSELRREREIPPFTLPPPKSSPAPGTDGQDLPIDPAFSYAPPRGPRRAMSQHADGDKRGTPRRRHDGVSQRGYDSYRPGDA